MNRFITDFRCACGLLGCTAAAAVVSLSGTAQAQTTAVREPLPLVCQETGLFAGWYSSELCKKALQAMRDNHRAGGPAHTAPQRPGRKTRRPSATPAPSTKSPPPTPRARTKAPGAAPTPGAAPKAPPPPKPGAAGPAPGARGLDPAPREQPLPPVLLLGLLGLLIPAAAIGFTVRHRTAFVPVRTGAESSPGLSYQPALDPFTGTALGLGGPGATGTARLVALTALESSEGTALVVIPRSEATLLFGLDDDELLDQSTDRLFIPGSLDAALAFLETELAVRREAAPHTAPPRLLLVADGDEEAARINELLAQDPGEISAVLVGDWPGDQVVVDEDGLVTAPPTLAGGLPRRVPAMSRTEARDRLTRLTGKRQRPDTPRGRRLRR